MSSPTKHTSQAIDNWSFDETYNEASVLVVAENAAGTALKRVKSDDDGHLQVDVLSEGVSSSIISGRKALTQTNVAEPLSAISVPCKKVEVNVFRTNVGDLAVGGADAIVAAGTEKGMILIAGGYQNYSISIDDLSKVYIIGTALDGVTFNYFN